MKSKHKQFSKLSRCGVYLLIVGNNFYIGKTTISFRQRFREHKKLLLSNSHSPSLQDSYNSFNRLLAIPLVSITIYSPFKLNCFLLAIRNSLLSQYKSSVILNQNYPEPDLIMLKVLKKNGQRIMEQYYSSINLLDKLLSSHPLSNEEIKKIMSEFKKPKKLSLYNLLKSNSK